MRAKARITAMLALAVSGFALLPAAAEAGRGRSAGGSSHARGFGGFHAHAAFTAAPRLAAAPIRSRPFAPGFRPGPPQRLGTLAPPVRPAGATFAPYRGAQVVRMPHAAPAYRYRAPGWGWAWGWGGVPAALPSVPTPGPTLLADPGYSAGAAPAGNCPAPPPEFWIGGRLWIPDHQACDGSIVPGRWGAESPLGLARN